MLSSRKRTSILLHAGSFFLAIELFSLFIKPRLTSVQVFLSFAEDRFLNTGPLRVLFLVWVVFMYVLWIKGFEKRMIPHNSKRASVLFQHYFYGLMWGLGIFGVAILLNSAFGVLQYYQIIASLPQIALSVITVFIFSCITSCAEELAFRGYLLVRFQELWNVHVACFAQALLFGFAHYRFSENFFDDLYITFSTMLAGLFLGYLYIFCDSLFASIGAHTAFHLNNLFYSQKIFSYNLDYTHAPFSFFRKNFGLFGFMLIGLSSVLLALLINRKKRLAD